MFTTSIRLFRSTVFRLSLIAAALFVASSFVIIFFIYYSTVTQQLRQVDKDIINELDSLEEIYKVNGADRLTKEIVYRTGLGNQKFYFLMMGDYFTSNIAVPTQFDEPMAPNVSFELRRRVPDGTGGLEASEERRMRARIRVLDEGANFILVGRDVETALLASEQVQRALLVAALISLLLGLLSGAYVSRRFARRIDSLNKLATDIRSGQLDRRAPRTESGDELDNLADHLNGMLDHIDRLMSAMRYAGDSIAHDLRSPLTRLRTSLESTASHVKDKEAKAALLSAAGDAGELLQTFESVLRIARLEAGDRRELLSAIDPKPLLDDLAELYEPSCEDAGLHFTVNLNAVPTIMADRGLISQGVSNLIENAIKYTPAGGNIELSLERTRAGRVEIAVTDSGPGIPPEHRQRVKERFVRLEGSRSKPGAGLGLSLVQAIADLHRASFDLTSGDASKGMAGLRAALVFPRNQK